MNEMTRMIGNIALYALLGYAAFALMLFVLQRKLLYLPSDFKPAKEQVLTEDLRYWPAYDNHRGFISAEEPAANKGTVIVFHGNAGTAYHRSFYAKALSRQGLRVILAEYPGYGGRGGQPSENVLVSDALATLRLAYQTYGEPLFLWGESLGSGVVAGVIGQTDIPVKGLILFLPWDSLASVAQTHYWYLPARWLVLDKYQSIDNLQRFDGNIAVILAERDNVVPVRHGNKLYESIKANKRLWLFEGAGNNSVPVKPTLPWWREVTDFIVR